jgi:hypothetical protein
VVVGFLASTFLARGLFGLVERAAHAAARSCACSTARPRTCSTRSSASSAASTGPVAGDALPRRRRRGDRVRHAERARPPRTRRAGGGVPAVLVQRRRARAHLPGGARAARSRRTART